MEDFLMSVKEEPDNDLWSDEISHVLWSLAVIWMGLGGMEVQRL